MGSSEFARFEAALRNLIRGELRLAEPLAPYTTLRIGGPADILFFPLDLEELARALSLANRHGLPFYVLGQGSNVLVPDGGVRGLVLGLGKATSFLRFDGKDATVGAGFSLPHLVQRAARRGLSGLETLGGIPGSVGGALVMNAGAAGRSIGDITRAVQVMDREGRIGTIEGAALGFGYRQSRLQAGDLIALAAELTFKAGDPEAIRAEIRRFALRRSRTQPLLFPNAGSIFKNPPGDFAGRLIEAVGAKGWRVGGAQISELHANFVINLGDATAADVIALMRCVARRVREAFGVQLEPEIRLLGRPQAELLAALAE